MKNSLIKTINKEIATKLINNGFTYVVERVNSQMIYSFLYTKELEDFLRDDFSKEDFFFEKKLRF